MMRWLSLVSVLAVLDFGAFIASAADAPWDSPAFSAKPDSVLRAAASVLADKDNEVEMLLEEHTYRFDAQGRQQRTSRQVFRYLTESSVEDWSSTEAEWSPWHEEKPVIRARVITPDGAVHALDPETIGEAPIEQDDPNLLSDQKLLRAPLPAIQVGAIVEEEILTRETRPLFDRGLVERLVLANVYPIRKLRVVVEAPAAMPVQYEVRGQELKPARTERDGRVRLVFEVGPVKAMASPEPHQPPGASRWPQLLFSTGKSWADVAAGYSALVEPQIDVEAVRPLVLETIGKETNRDKVVARLLAALRSQVRYAGLEFGRGAIVPRKPSEVLLRRYGDCKDQSALLAAMLRAAGMPAHLALLRCGRSTDVAIGMPGLGDFDHCIVYVPGQRPLWIDPTARCVPAGELPLVDQGRLALVAAPDTKELLRTPEADYRQNKSAETFEISLTERGKGRVRVTVTGGGSCDEEMREDYAAQSNKDLRKAWRDYFKDVYRTQSLTTLEYSAPLDLSKPFRVVAEAADARLARVAGNEAVVAIQPEPLFDRLPGLFVGILPEPDEDSPAENASPAERKSALLLPEPHVRQLQFRITPPPGFTVKALPEGFTKQFGPATISQSFTKEQDVVVATFRLDTGPGNFTAAEVNALCKGVGELGPDGDVAQWEVKIIFQRASSGDPKPEPAKENPDEGRVKKSRKRSAAGVPGAGRNEPGAGREK